MKKCFSSKLSDAFRQKRVCLTKLLSPVTWLSYLKDGILEITRSEEGQDFKGENLSGQETDWRVNSLSCSSCSKSTVDTKFSLSSVFMFLFSPCVAAPAACRSSLLLRRGSTWRQPAPASAAWSVLWFWKEHLTSMSRCGLPLSRSYERNLC